MLEQFLNWFTGAPDYTYGALATALKGDHIFAIAIMILALIVSIGFFFIASRWSESIDRKLDNEAYEALNGMKWMFIWCGAHGFLLVLFEIFWPAWRLYALFLVAMLIIVWRYVFQSMNGLVSVYRYIQDRDQLVREIMLQKNIIADLREEMEKKTP